MKKAWVRQKKKAILLLLGNHHESLSINPSAYAKILRHELALYGSWNSSIFNTPNEWDECLQMMADGRANTEELIKCRRPLSRIVETFNELRDKKIESVKCIIKPGE